LGKFFTGENFVLWNASGGAVEGVGLRPLVCRDCGFESRRGHGCLSVVCCVLSGTDLFNWVDPSSRGVLENMCHWLWSDAEISLYTPTVVS